LFGQEIEGFSLHIHFVHAGIITIMFMPNYRRILRMGDIRGGQYLLMDRFEFAKSPLVTWKNKGVMELTDAAEDRDYR
jgi:hypothetical protein